MSPPEAIVSVVLPLIDPRGDLVERMRPWTEGQTCPGERVQISLTSDGSQLPAEASPAEARTEARGQDGGCR